jgi:hypothetical protein
MRWAGYVAGRGGEIYRPTECYTENQKEREHLEDLGIYGWVINWILKNEDLRVWKGLLVQVSWHWRYDFNATMNRKVP